MMSSSRGELQRIKGVAVMSDTGSIGGHFSTREGGASMCH